MILNEFYNTQRPDTVVFSFARMQPPTLGHCKLIKKVIETAKQHNADHMLFLSQTNNAETDPLLWEDKRNIVNMMFPGLSISEDVEAKTPFHALRMLGERYDNVILVVGEDRVEEFKTMENYTKDWGINSFAIVESGKRNDNGGVESISSTIAREYATHNKFNDFRTLLPETLSEDYVNDIFNKVRRGLNL